MPSPSPFCSKLECWLRMAEIPYRTELLSGPPRSSTGKMPYIRRPDGTILPDSSQIIRVLGQEHGRDLEAGLSPAARAQVHLVQRMVEEHLYWALARHRWIDPVSFAITRDNYFAAFPAPVRYVIAAVLRRQIRQSLHGHGLGRLPEPEIVDRARRDLDALAGLVGDGEWVVGQPTTADAILYAFLGGMLSFPHPSPMSQHLRQQAGLVALVERVRARWWPDGPLTPGATWTPPS